MIEVIIIILMEVITFINNDSNAKKWSTDENR